MTADNLTFALEIDFIPDLQEGRDDFKKKMKMAEETFYDESSAIFIAKKICM